MKHRSFILAGILGVSLSSMFFLPAFRNTDSALSMEIPERLGAWHTRSYEASQKERDILAPDTRFSKAQCLRPKPNSYDFLTGRYEAESADVSIVMSGHDLANSIHRPERCMPAQGHEIYQSEKVVLEVPGERAIPARRLLSQQKSEIPGTKDVVVRNILTIYFFVGHDVITENHTQRTLLDMKDRLKKGEAQSWAYVSVGVPFRPDSADAAEPGSEGLPTLQQADKTVRELLGDLVARNINWKQIVN